MDDQLWRLTWALPLVIVIGVGLIYWLKRLGVGALPAESGATPVVLSNTPLTEHTRVLVVQVNQRPFIVFESTAHLSVQTAHTDMHPLPPVSPWRFMKRKP